MQASVTQWSLSNYGSHKASIDLGNNFPDVIPMEN